MKRDEQFETIIKDLDKLREHIKKQGNLSHCTLIGLKLEGEAIDWHTFDCMNTNLLGCELEENNERILLHNGAQIFRKPEHLPYDPFRKQLYSWQELMEGWSPTADNSLDHAIYQHFSASRFNPGLTEALFQRIHDHAIDEGLRKLLRFNENGMSAEKGVGFMGGHSKSRKDESYIKTARCAWLMAKEHFFVVSGGGPGIMEAANLGAYFSPYEEEALTDALNMLSKSAEFYIPGTKQMNPAYMERAYEVLEKYPKGGKSLAIPTWFYGHEPSNLFASHIAKYFSNSLREDNLLAISLYGVVFAEGSAGTTQEIFMDATQNHYGTFNFYSPMVFLGKKRYEIDTMIYPLLKQLAWNREYASLLHITDKPTSVVSFIKAHPPIMKQE
ncbi:MAG: hypothetical protein AAF655_03710 [Bacteroidota bacterium]